VRLYAEVARRGFRRYSTYRAATAAGAFTNTAFGFIKAFVLIALWRTRPALGGYDVADAVTFSFIAQALIAPVAVFGPGLEVAERIRTGDVVTDLYRPADFQAWWLAADLGRAGFELIARGAPPLLAGIIAFRLPLPTSPTTWAAFALCALLAVTVSFGLRYLIAAAGFWLLDVRGLTSMHMLVALFFSGSLVPLVIFPGALGAAARLLPWAAMIQVPGDVFLGKRTGFTGIGTALAFQLGWALVLLYAGRLVTVAARRKLVIHGG
jgi:viologen exporter family transport system permease protein